MIQEMNRKTNFFRPKTESERKEDQEVLTWQLQNLRGRFVHRHKNKVLRQHVLRKLAKMNRRKHRAAVKAILTNQSQPLWQIKIDPPTPTETLDPRTIAAVAGELGIESIQLTGKEGALNQAAYRAGMRGRGTMKIVTDALAVAGVRFGDQHIGGPATEGKEDWLKENLGVVQTDTPASERDFFEEWTGGASEGEDKKED